MFVWSTLASTGDRPARLKVLFNLLVVMSTCSAVINAAHSPKEVVIIPLEQPNKRNHLSVQKSINAPHDKYLN